jgi:autotransporter-associated beta strand protein
MKSAIIGTMSIVVVLGLAAVSQGAEGYQSDFTGSTLASAGMAKSAGAAGGSWAVNGTKLVGVGGGNARSNVSTIDSWQSDSGFILNVTFEGSAGFVRHDFGIVDAAYTISASSAWLTSSLAGAYGVGFSTTIGATDGLFFNNDAGTVTTLSTNQGDIAFGIPQTISITVTSNSWSYSLNGAAATTGSHTFDTSRSYRFTAHAQSCDKANFANITLTPIQSFLGLWTGINGATWDASTTNFANNAYNAPLNNITFDVAKATEDRVTFADHYWDNSINTVVTQDLVTVAAGGVSVGNVDFQNNSVDYTVNGADATGITGTSALTINGFGAVTLSTNNTYSGGTTLSNGTLIVGNSSAIGTNTLTLAGGTLRTGSTGANLNEATVVSGTTAVFSGGGGLTLSGNISGSGTLVIGGSGSGQAAGGVAITDNLDDFTGTIIFNSVADLNSFSFGGENTVVTTAALEINGSNNKSNIRLWKSATFGELSGNGGILYGDNRRLTLNQDTDTTFAGQLMDVNGARELGLIKNGSGRLTLSGQNPYEWETTVNGTGTLEVSGRLSETKSITVGSGAAFELTGSGSLGSGGVFNGGAEGPGNVSISGTFEYNSTTDQELGGLVTVNSGGHLSYGAAAGTLTMSGGLTLNDGASLDYEMDAGDSGASINITDGTFTGAASADGVTVNVTMSGVPVPPVTYTLIDWSGSTASGVNIGDFNLVFSGDDIVGSRLSIVGDTLVLNVVPAGMVFMVR